MNNNNTTPQWDLSDIYPSLTSKEYIADKTSLFEEISILNHLAEKEISNPAHLKKLLAQYEKTAALFENLISFVYCCYSVDTTNSEAIQELGAVEKAEVPFSTVMTVLRNSLSAVEGEIKKWLEKDSDLIPFRLFIEEQLLLKEHQMTAIEESLAADLSRSGGEAWSKLQQQISSDLSTEWKNPLTQKSETKTVTELRALAFDPEREVRKSAFQQEIKLWESVRISMAAALNGVKGWAVTLNPRRNWQEPLERSLLQNRISGRALDAMIQAMESALPQFRTYLNKKAQYLGIESCAFYDIFAPLRGKQKDGSQAKVWSFDEAREFICSNFHSFSRDLGEFAEEAFSKKWIDAKPARGKVGGAYCISFPHTGQSRILSNFTGTYSDVGTLAHELGHGYHHHILKDNPQVHREYPMTLAETASIFCETIVFNSALKDSRLDSSSIIESYLQDATQVIVDILSRFYFERRVFEIRKERELSPDEFCNLMTEAQKKAYGEGLDENSLHPYMWAVKGHYYSPELGFYNFPYAFGLLFGLGLYSRYKEEGAAFAGTYREILSNTGSMGAVELCRSAGFDIETEAFWAGGLSMIKGYIDQL